MRTIYRDIVGAVIESRDGKILHGKQAGNVGTYFGCWLIPGGGMDQGETPDEAIIREILEETGLDVTCYPRELLFHDRKAATEKIIRGTGEKVWYEMHFYDFKILIPLNAQEIPVTPSDDLVELLWIDRRELSNYPLPPPSVELFKKLGYIT